MSNYEVIYQELKTKRGYLRGLLTLPKEKKGLVLMFHGYTGHKNENGFLFKQISLKIKDLGFASLRFDFYGSGDSDGDFKEMTFRTELEDGASLIDYAYKLNDEKPIILLGFSMGGAIAGYLSPKNLEKIAKLILLSPAGCMDLHAKRTFDTNPLLDNDCVDLGGFLLHKNFMESFAGIDLFEDITKFTKPVLIVHGKEDQAVPFEYGLKYHSMYKNSKFFGVEGSPHCYTKVEYREELQSHIVDFLKEEN